jgi:cytochrome b561
VIVGLHWLGALLAIFLFALWCGRLEPRRDVPAPA